MCSAPFLLLALGTLMVSTLQLNAVIANLSDSSDGTYGVTRQIGDLTVVAECSYEKFAAGNPFANALGNVVAELETKTLDYIIPSINTTLGTQSTEDGVTAYGEGTCYDSASRNVCGSCLKTVGDSVWGICQNAVAASFDTAYCKIRYDKVPI